MSTDPTAGTDRLPISPMVDRVMNRFHIKLIERRVNERLGGDATIGQIVELMIDMGWQPPHRETTEVSDT
jgi:hypothetical protein